ncbi:hypothetical protein ML462_10990 [Gramella lutea]|uniref:Uncharacterized protein n=1 Tax=Christiangramia lutea TaxID=1607951 RepID=A0A9X1V418_9FLAO|nr:hypothetical protein [Christiangramia lutea]MCH4823696.1 hypothetical protein [Christiangramia lutea]
MSKFYYLAFTIIITNFSTAQKTSYEFQPEHTKKVLDPAYKDGYFVYQANFKNTSIPKYDTIDVQTTQYTTILKKIEQKKSDSIAEKKIKAKYDEILSINSLIDHFLYSSGSFKKKKHHLYQAQLLSNKHNLDYLIYADKEFNSDNRKRFSSIKWNGLENHLKTIKSKISTDGYYNENTYLYTELNTLRNKLNRTPKTEKAIKQVGHENKKLLLRGDRIEDFENLSGKYKIIGEYNLIRNSTYEAISGQLLKTDSLKTIHGSNLYGYGSTNTLLENQSGNMIYCSYEFVNKFGIDNQISDYISLLENNGYKTDLDGEILYIEAELGRVRATYDVYEEVQKGNFKYIDQIANSIIQFNNIMKKATPLTDKLANHYNAHRNFTMTDSRLKKWKNDAKTGVNLLNQIKSLKGNEENISDYFLTKIDSKTTEEYIEFLQVLNGTKVVLGL